VSWETGRHDFSRFWGKGPPRGFARRWLRRAVWRRIERSLRTDPEIGR